MKPITLIVVLMCLWALSNLWLLPLATKRWEASTLREKVARAGTMAVLEKIRDLSIIGAATVFGVILLVWLSSWLASTSASPAKGVLVAASTLYAWAKAWNEHLAAFISSFALLGIALCLWLAAKRAKRRMVEAWHAKASQVFDAFPTSGAIEAARHDPALSPILDDLDELIVQAEALQARIEQPGAAEQLEATHECVGVVLSALATEIAAKDLDIEAALKDAERPEPTSSPTRWQRIRTILVSEQLSKDLGFVRKRMSYVLTSLLLLNLVGWTAEPLANSLQLAVNNLRVNAFAEQRQKELDEAISQARPVPDPVKAHDDLAPDVPTAQSVQLVTRMLAHAATNDLLRARVLEAGGARTPKAPEGASHVAGAVPDVEFVRGAILDDTMPAAAATDVDKVRAETADDIARARGPGSTDSLDATRTRLERELRPVVEDLHARNPGLFARVARAAEARYSVPMSPLDAQGKIVGEMLNRVFGEVDANLASEAGKQGEKLVKAFGSKAVETWLVGYAKDFVAEEIRAAAEPNVRARMRARPSPFVGPSWVDDVGKRLADASDAMGGWKESMAVQREAQIAHNVRNAASARRVEDILLRTGGVQAGPRATQMAEDPVQRLASYEAMFPSDFRFTDGLQVRRAATSFARARVSSFVRGVLIGRDLEGPGVDIIGLRWKLHPAQNGAPTKVDLNAFFKGDGAWKRLGMFDAGILNQALRYAADRRVVATTIVAGDGLLIGRRTSTHPALIDTPLGCRIIESDRLIDAFSSPESNPPVALRALAADREQMHAWLGQMRLAAAVASGPVAPKGACVKALTAAAAKTQLKTIGRFSASLDRALDRFLAGLDGKHDGASRYMLKAKTCTPASQADFVACVCSDGQRGGLIGAYWIPEDHTSQLREKDFLIGSDLAWFRRSPDRMGNLDFAVHTTFSVHGKSATGDEDEYLADAFDFPKPQMDVLRHELARSVPGYITGANGDGMREAASYDDFMVPIKDFVIFQRFFRAAFGGSLGRDFPFANLVKLERATKAFVPHQLTVRWEPAIENPDWSDLQGFNNDLTHADPKAGALHADWFNDQQLRLTSHRPLCDVVSK